MQFYLQDQLRSGANLQPWHFVVIKNKEIKKKIRIEAEKEEE